MLDNHTYKKIEIIGSSPKSVEDAIKNANGDVAHYQVTLKIGMRIQSDH